MINEDKEFNELADAVIKLYEQTRGMKAGDWAYKAPETSITKLLLTINYNLNQRILELESMVYGR